MLFSILLLLAPAHAADTVTERHEMVPMRDGARLSTYLYIPPGNGPWPVLYEQRYANRQLGAFVLLVISANAGCQQGAIGELLGIKSANMVPLIAVQALCAGVAAGSASRVVERVTPVSGSTAEAVPSPPLIRPATAPKPSPALPSANSRVAASAASRASRR